MLKQRNFFRVWHDRRGGGLKNPLFPDKHGSALHRLVWTLGVGTFALLAVFSLAVYGPLLRITDVRIDGLTTIAPAEIEALVAAQREKRRFFVFPQNTTFMFNAFALEKTLTTTYAFDKIHVDTEGRTLVVAVKESVSYVALRAGGRTYFAGRDGAIIREASEGEVRAIDVRLGLAIPAEGETLPVLQPGMPIIAITALVEGSEPTLTAQKVQGVLTLVEQLFVMRITPKLVTFARVEDQWVSVSTEAGYEILVDVTESIDPQMISLSTVLDNTNSAVYDYIDVRFGEHVFVKEL